MRGNCMIRGPTPYDIGRVLAWMVGFALLAAVILAAFGFWLARAARGYDLPRPPPPAPPISETWEPVAPAIEEVSGEAVAHCLTASVISVAGIICILRYMFEKEEEDDAPPL